MIRTALIVLVVCSALFGVHALMSGPEEPQEALEGAALQALVESVQLVPVHPQTHHTMRVLMEGASRADYEAVSVTWYRNGEAIEGYDAVELTPEHFGKGDQLEADVQVRKPVPGVEAPAVATDVVFVDNTPPRIVESSVNVSRDGGSDYLYARVNAVDADGDILDYAYTWYKNGDEVTEEVGDTFDLTRCRAGDRVHAVVVAWDGEVESAPNHSTPIEIGSDAPVITSNPPSALEDRRFVYQVAAVSADAGLLTFDLVEAPEGMTVSDEGLIDWSLPTAVEGEQQFDIVVRVTNEQGAAAFQDFSITVQGSRP